MNPVARTEDPPFPLSLDGFPMTPSNVTTMLMRQMRVGRQEAQRIFPNIRFANVPHME